MKLFSGVKRDRGNSMKVSGVIQSAKNNTKKGRRDQRKIWREIAGKKKRRKGSRHQGLDAAGFRGGEYCTWIPSMVSGGGCFPCKAIDRWKQEKPRGAFPVFDLRKNNKSGRWRDVSGYINQSETGEIKNGRKRKRKRKSKKNKIKKKAESAQKKEGFHFQIPKKPPATNVLWGSPPCAGYPPLLKLGKIFKTKRGVTVTPVKRKNKGRSGRSKEQELEQELNP